MSKTRALVMALLMALVSYTLWAAFNRPQEVAAWPAHVQGFAFSPVRAGQNPNEKRFPSIVDIDRDLALLAGKVGSVRTYSVEDSFAEIPALAQKRGLAVTLGVWLSGDLVRNEMELARAIDLVHTHKNIARLIVGNEVLLRGDLTEAELVRYIERARKAVKIPVSTADIWSTWLSHPVLARHVDFIAAHVLPYWEGMPVQQSV